MLNVNLKYQILTRISIEDSLQINQIKRVKDKRYVSRNGTTVLRSTQNESIKIKLFDTNGY